MNAKKLEKVQKQSANNSPDPKNKIAMQDMLGAKLRAYYDEVASEPIPDRFTELLKALEAKSAEKKQG